MLNSWFSGLSDLLVDLFRLLLSLLGLVVVVVATLLPGGCIASHQGDYAWGFEISTGYKFTQTAPQTEPATAELDVDPLVNNLIDLGWTTATEEAAEPVEPVSDPT